MNLSSTRLVLARIELVCKALFGANSFTSFTQKCRTCLQFPDADVQHWKDKVSCVYDSEADEDLPVTGRLVEVRRIEGANCFTLPCPQGKN